MGWPALFGRGRLEDRFQAGDEFVGLGDGEGERREQANHIGAACACEHVLLVNEAATWGWAIGSRRICAQCIA